MNEIILMTAIRSYRVWRTLKQNKTMRPYLHRVSSIGALLVILLSCTSCASIKNETIKQEAPKRYQGYWTAGEAFSYFTLLDRSQSYWIDEKVPDDVNKFFDKQPLRHDPFHVGVCQAIYLDVLGKVIEESNGVKHLHIESVFEMKPASADFFTEGAHPCAYWPEPKTLITNKTRQ